MGAEENVEAFIYKDRGVLKDCLVREACNERAEGGSVVCLGRNSSKESIPKAEEGCSLVCMMVLVSCRTSFIAETQGKIGTSTEGLEFKNGDGSAQFNVTESPQGWPEPASRPIALGELPNAVGPAVRVGRAFNVGND